MFANEDQENGGLTRRWGKEKAHPRIQSSSRVDLGDSGDPDWASGCYEEDNFEARQRGWLLQKFGYLRKSNGTQEGDETARSDSNIKAVRARKGTNKETLGACDVLVSSEVPWVM